MAQCGGCGGLRWFDNVMDASSIEGASAEALAIYVVAARDACDALEMIEECASPATLAILRDMLEAPGSEKTDRSLNLLLAGPVERRLAELAKPENQEDSSAAEGQPTEETT